jgi:hypothetical protein
MRIQTDFCSLSNQPLSPSLNYLSWAFTVLSGLGLVSIPLVAIQSPRLKSFLSRFGRKSRNSHTGLVRIDTG